MNKRRAVIPNHPTNQSYQTLKYCQAYGEFTSLLAIING